MPLPLPPASAARAWVSADEHFCYRGVGFRWRWRGELPLTLPQPPPEGASDPVPMARLRLGRKAPLVWSYLQLAVSGVAAAYFGSFGAYCALRFLMGMTFSSIILNSLSLGESSQGGAGGEGSAREGARQPHCQMAVSSCGVLIQ